MRKFIVSKEILLSLFYLLIPYFCLECSLINPDLAPELPGYEEFAKGRAHFNEDNWEEATYFLNEAIKKAHKLKFYCRNYITFDGYGSVCDDIDKYIGYEGYEARSYKYEIDFAVYRHSQFYLALIRLHQKEFAKANLHFKKAIGFNGVEDRLGIHFYKCANIINPYWISLASLTRLQVGNMEEAEKLTDLAFWTIASLDDAMLDRYYWERWAKIQPKYWDDFSKRGFTSKKWRKIQLIIAFNIASIVAISQNDLDTAIDLATQAIWTKDDAIKSQVFSGESEEHSILYHNRGTFYFQKNLYHEALTDYTKALELNSSIADIYFHRGHVYHILEEYSKTLLDYHQAILLDPNNPEYYRQRALVYTVMGCIDKARLDLESAELEKNKLKIIQNELGLHEFSKGSFQKAINHFSNFIELHPHLAIGYQNRAASFYQAGDLEEALYDYDAAIQLSPTQPDLYQMRATVLMSLPAKEEEDENAFLIEAQDNLLTALKLNPQDAKIYQNLAALSSSKGNLEAALMYYNQALELASDQDQVHIFKNLSSLYLQLGEYEKAHLNCEKAIEMGCREGGIYFVRGCCFFEKNQIEQAIENYKLANQFGYEDSKVYFNRAKAYFCLNQLDHVLDDATKAIQVDPTNTECYKLRGLIFLAKHQEQEAYSDFSRALHISSADLFINENEENYSGVKLNDEGTLFQSNGLMTSLDGRLIYKQKFQSQLILNEYTLAKKMGQIDLYPFGKGLSVGLMNGGVETLKELGPFVTNLLFHPIETTENLLIAIHFLLSKALENDWETVFEALAPELKELFLTWDKIDDFHKGKLTGLFIGKNGMAALIALGAMNTISKLNNVMIGSSKTKFSCLLKRTKPEVTPLSIPELSLPTVSQGFGWHLPYAGGAIISENFYTEHSLGRISSNSVQNTAILEAKAIKTSKELGIPFATWDEFEKGALSETIKPLSIDSRTIPTSMIEAEIGNASFTSGNIEVVLEGNENLFNVVHATKLGKILVRNLNTKKHIMQPKHAWDKLIKLTGDVEVDCKNVVKLLEDNQIFLEKYQLKQPRTFEKFVRYRHQMTINGNEIEAIFNKNLETGELFLNNAWVITE